MPAPEPRACPLRRTQAVKGCAHHFVLFCSPHLCMTKVPASTLDLFPSCDAQLVRCTCQIGSTDPCGRATLQHLQTFPMPMPVQVASEPMSLGSCPPPSIEAPAAVLSSQLSLRSHASLSHPHVVHGQCTPQLNHVSEKVCIQVRNLQCSRLACSKGRLDLVGPQRER